MRMMTMAAMLAGAGSLAGCAQISLVTKAIEYAGIAGDLEDAAEGEAVTLPEGTAEYNGVVGIGATYEDGGVLMLGDAALTADFGAGTIDGVLSDFVVAELDTDVDVDEFLLDPTGSVFQFETATGQIDLSNGTIIATGFEADFNGAITLNANVYTADGTMIGEFRGANAELIQAWANAKNMTLKRGAVDATDVELEMVAEAD